MKLRRAQDRGHADHGWLNSWHSFSFADYYDREHMHFGALRVINEDRVQPGMGFGTHAHRDMEIVSYVLEGKLEHKDSLGTGSVIVPGDVQRMSAGTGVRHSEYNPSRDEAVHFLQIWIVPDKEGIEPSYEQKHIHAADKRGRLCLIASQDARDGSVLLHQDAAIYAGVLDADDTVTHVLKPGRRAYVHMARGIGHVNGERLLAGDAAMIDDEVKITVDRTDSAEVLLFDLV
jgi:redox-sensitive bicupin YhaK (pirin superfamily)